MLFRSKARWLSEEALQIAVKRREAKSKGEKERYKHLNAKFQRIARRDKKASLSDKNKFCNTPNGKHYQEAKMSDLKYKISNCKRFNQSHTATV